jgi:hypothetical protein
MRFEQNDVSMTAIVCQKGGLSHRWTIPSIHIHSKGHMLSNNMLWFLGIWLFYDAQSLAMTAFLTIFYFVNNHHCLCSLLGCSNITINIILTLLCHGIESTLLGWFYDLIFTCCLCAGNSLFIESTQKGRFYGSKSSRPGYVPRETFFIESPQMGRFYESEPARPWLYRQKLLIRDICPFSEVPRVYCLDFWKKFAPKLTNKKEHRIDPFGSILWQKNGKSWNRPKRVDLGTKGLMWLIIRTEKLARRKYLCAINGMGTLFIWAVPIDNEKSDSAHDWLLNTP